MKFVLASLGSRGDVEPFSAVGRELLRRGHDVLLAVPSNLLGFVESAGLAAVAYGPDAQELRKADFVRNSLTIQNPLNVAVELMEHVTRLWPQYGMALKSLANGADLLMTSASEQGVAANVAEYYDIPLAALHFFPTRAFEPGGSDWGVIKDVESAQRRALGLPEATGPSTQQALEIQAYDELCFPGLAAEWAEGDVRRPFVGSLTLELPTDSDDEVLSWIADGTPPIYFGFGSNVRVAFAAQAVATISAACAQLGERALICSGESDFSDIPHFDHVKVVDAVNHSAIFPACRAVVHHGGAGTTAAGMRAGVPTLILWLWVDQPIWAAVVEWLKVGSGRRFSGITQESLVADLQSILIPECATRARVVAAQMTKSAESVARTADLLEETARRGRRG